MSRIQSPSRREIKALIRKYEQREFAGKAWYQNIQFRPLLETRRSPVDIVWARLRGHVSKEELLISHMPRLDAARVIDIGCNSGLYSVEASCRGAAFVLGVDRSVRRLEQANDVAELFRRLGRPIGELEFRLVDDINNNLDLLADKDVVIASRVLYHLEPLSGLQAAIVRSNVKLLILQGNMARFTRSEGQPRTHAAQAGDTQDVASLEGLRRFCSSMGFTPSVAVDHASPVVIASR